MDRTHWFGCWKVHHECALARIEQLEGVLEKIRESALNIVSLSSKFQVQIQLTRVIFDIDRVKERE